MKTIAALLLLTFHLSAFCQNDTTFYDLANLKKYAEENKNLATKLAKENRVVFLGD